LDELKKERIAAAVTLALCVLFVLLLFVILPMRATIPTLPERYPEPLDTLATILVLILLLLLVSSACLSIMILGKKPTKRR
jgi:hypothetical protein